MADTAYTAALAAEASVTRSTGAGAYGITRDGFVPKPFLRLMAEKMAVARSVLGEDLDLTPGSVLTTLLALTCLEETRTWASLATMYDNAFVATATGEALSRLGDELGLARPYLEARGTVTLKLAGDPPADGTLTIPRGARMLTPGGDHAATDQTVVLSAQTPQLEAAVVAFYPGPEHNLDPGDSDNRLDRWNPLDDKVEPLFVKQGDKLVPRVTIDHRQPLRGGELQWPDARYRDLLLRAPRSVWTVDALVLAVSLVPGVRGVKVYDAPGGLDLNASLKGSSSLVERLFGTEPDLGRPYAFTLLVAPTPAAVWDGADGLEASIQRAIGDLRPIGLFARIERGESAWVGLEASLYVPSLYRRLGAGVNQATPAVALKTALLEGVRRYVDGLSFGEAVRYAEVVWALMSEQSLVDMEDLRLLRFPPDVEADGAGAVGPQRLEPGQNLELEGNQVPVTVDDPSRLVIQEQA